MCLLCAMVAEAENAPLLSSPAAVLSFVRSNRISAAMTSGTDHVESQLQKGMVSSRFIHSTRSSITVIKGHGHSLVHLLDTILTMLIPPFIHREHRCTSIPISSRASDGAITTSGYESSQRRSGRQADISIVDHSGSLYLMSASSSSGDAQISQSRDSVHPGHHHTLILG